MSSFKIYYIAIITKWSWYQHRNRHVAQWNRIEDLDVSPHSYTHLTFAKRGKKPKHSGGKTDFHQMMLRNLETCRRLTLDPYLSYVPKSAPRRSETLVCGRKFWNPCMYNHLNDTKVKITNYKKICLLWQMVFGKSSMRMWKNKTRLLAFTPHKTKF